MSKTQPDELADYIEQASDFLDERLYSPIYNSSAREFEASVSSAVKDFRTFRKINNRLKTAKVLSLASSIFCAISSLRCLSSLRPVRGVVFAVLALDFARASYNCYIKKYVSLAAKKLGGDWSKMATTVIQAAGSALGLGGEDPFHQLRNNVMWDLILDGTIMPQLVLSIKNSISRN